MAGCAGERGAKMAQRGEERGAWYRPCGWRGRVGGEDGRERTRARMARRPRRHLWNFVLPCIQRAGDRDANRGGGGMLEPCINTVVDAYTNILRSSRDICHRNISPNYSTYIALGYAYCFHS
jgi:hypothetical protein